MKTCILATGSKGNSTYIASSNTNILIDLGTTSLYVEKQLKNANIDPKLIEAIVLTHTHIDHVNGIRVFMKKYHPTLYLTEKMYKELNREFEIEKYKIIDGDFDINDIHFRVFKTSHDAPDSNGYVIENNNRSIVYIKTFSGF